MSVESCSHDELEFGINTETVEEYGRRTVVAKISARCSSCQTMFSWSGINSGTPNAHEPVVSADGYEIRAPIVPRPGATVGILMRAGLEDKLRHPSEVNADG